MHRVTALGPRLRKPKASPFLQPLCSAKTRGFPRMPQARKGLCPSASEGTADKRGGPQTLLLLAAASVPGALGGGAAGHVLDAAPI